MRSTALLPFVPLLASCVIVTGDDGADDNAEDSTSGDGDGDPSGDGDGDPTGDGDPSGDGDGDPAAQWCGLDDTGPDQPWFTLEQFGEALTDGGDLAVECGFQGFFMIELDPDMGGFVPQSDYVSFSVTLDVEGYDVGPDGHFAIGDFNIFVACCDDEYYGCYYEPMTIQLFPPDAIADLSVIHGAPAQLSVTMDTVGGPVSQTLDVQMWAMEENMSWEFCSYNYGAPGEDLAGLAGLPIPG